MSNKPGYSLTHEDMEKLWKSSSDGGKYYLFSTFGVKKETFLPDIMERVTDFDSAEIELKRRYNTPIGPSYVKPNVFDRLTAVADALNEGCPEEEKVWMPLFDGNGNYATSISESTIKPEVDLWKPFSGAFISILATMQLRSARHLMVRSEKLAAYFGKQFESDWKILYS